MMKPLSLTLAVVLFATGATVSADHHEPGFISLFDGKSLTDWDGNSKFWSVEDGAITGQTTSDNPTKGNTFLIWRGGKLDDFDLRLSYRIVGGNSGVQYRSKDLGNWVVGGYQADIDSGPTFSGILYDERGRGILAKRGELTHIVSTDDGKHKVHVVASLGESDEINNVIKKEDWNEYQIVAHESQFLHVINGRVTCQVIDEDAANAEASGILALQLHAGPPMKVQFKDIRIKPFRGIDVSGKWNVKVITDNGQGTPTFTFHRDGNQLSGDYSGAFGEAKLEGKIYGSEVTWTVVGSYEGQEVKCVYKGALSGLNTMKGTVKFNDQFDATWTAKKQ